MKIYKALLALPAVLSLTGCTFGTSIDNLMAPPKLSVEQEQIFSALTKATGQGIRLKYPKSGKYLSAFIIDDIDGDGGNEAVVFYERNGLGVDEITLRINVLDQDGDKWRSVYDNAAEGSEIEKVIISRLGNNDRINLIVGSSLINRSEKNVTIYNYDPDEGAMKATFGASYSFIDVTDLDGDNNKEFLLLNGSSNGSPAVAKAFQLDAEGKYHEYACELSDTFADFDNLSYGRLPDGKTGLYIDAVSGTGSIQTDIVYMDSDGGLKKVFAPEASHATLRPSGCASYDIDNDGELEIPVQEIAPSYEDVSEGEQIKLTDWKRLGSDNTLEHKYLSYFSIGEGYAFIFPEKWRGKVTVVRDAINDEMVFCTYIDGNITRELLRICCAEDSVSQEDRISTGYMLLHTKGESSYLAYIPPYPDTGDGLSINSGDVAINFRFKE